MQLYRCQGCWKAWAIGLVCCLVIGCGSGIKSTPPRQMQHIRGLWHIYLEYMTKHKGTAPKDAEELKAWARENLTSERLQVMGVASLEDAFISPRDQLPYIVRPVDSKDLQTALRPDDAISKNPPKAPVAIYEQKGQDGKRFLAYAFGQVAELPEAMMSRVLGH